MIQAETGASKPDIPFYDKDFQSIARIAKSEFGLHLDGSKKALIQSRLTRRLRGLGLQSFADYCDVIERGAGGERDLFISALTTNVTHFFREPHHFTYLEAEVLPNLIASARHGQRVRIWSAGCSTGQEPYSIAGSVCKLCPEAAQLDIRILATDIDPEVIKRAEAARYLTDERRFADPSWQDRVFEPAQLRLDEARVRAELKELLSFRRLNLMEQWPMKGRFDIIFCRNVAIYFDKPTQSRLWSRFSQQLGPGGHLFIGHSERVHGPALPRLESVGITTYRTASAGFETDQ